jgi:hypothetical protein
MYARSSKGFDKMRKINAVKLTALLPNLSSTQCAVSRRIFFFVFSNTARKKGSQLQLKIDDVEFKKVRKK